MKKAASILLTTSLGFGACAGPDDAEKGYGAPRAPTLDEQSSIDGLVGALVALGDLVDTPDSADAWSRMMELQGYQAALTQPTTAPGRPTGAAAQAGFMDCMTISDDGQQFRYDNCQFLGISLDGRVRWWEEDGGYAHDMDVRLDYPTQGFATHLTGGLLIGGDAIRSLEGADLGLRTDTTITAGAYVSHSIIDGIYDVRVTNDCATGGFIELHGTVSVDGLSGTATDVWTLMEFGPNCGDVTLR